MTELIEAGLTVTVVGMSVVFVLLTLLVWIIGAMSRLSRWIEGSLPAAQRPAAATAAEDEELIVGVVSAAIAAFRARGRGRGN
jgi:sodium pump decarboxylase gamma subunit